MAEKKLTIIGCGNQGISKAALEGLKAKGFSIILINKINDLTVIARAEPTIYEITKTPDICFEEPFIKKEELNKHPFDKFINGKGKKKHSNIN